MRTLFPFLCLLLLATGCQRAPEAWTPPPGDPDLLHDAVRMLTDVMIHDIFSPPQASRTYAYPSIAAYEALRPAFPPYQSLAGQVNGLEAVPAPPGQVYHPLASIAAFMTTGRALVFSDDSLDVRRDSLMARFQTMGIPQEVFDRSVAWGDSVGQHILRWATTDRFRETRSMPKFTVTEEPGRWHPTPPAYMDGMEPNWHLHRPFALDSARQVVPPPAPRFDMTPGSPFVQLVTEVYETGRNLTDEQKEIAWFWDCNPLAIDTQGHLTFGVKKMTPGGHWMGIAAAAARKAQADMMRTAEAYALVGTALADAFITCWGEKYTSNLIRPETVINEHMDEAWLPLLQTPPFPEYTSGHSTVSGAASTVLAHLFGENFAFTDSSEVRFGLTVRSFSSFQEAAEEASISRLYGGIHYRPALDEGLRQGRTVGQAVIERIRTR